MIGNRDVMLTLQCRRKPDVRTLLTGDRIPEHAQAFHQLATRDIAWQPHAVRTSSRTICSRISFGWISDRLGGLRTLLVGSALQGIALLLFLPFNGLVSLYLISAMFGLFQGGIVPAYAIIIREYFSPKEAGARVGIVITASLFGMALGGWMSGAIFDATGSYKAAFLNGIAWNLVNVMIAAMLLIRLGGGRVRTAGA